MPRPEAANGPKSQRQPTATHYDVLGVGRSADSLQIRAAYVRLLKDCHPDSAPVGAGSRSADVERLVTAYKTLKDERLRAAYDAQLQGVLGGQVTRRPPLPARRRRRGHQGKLRATIAVSMLGLILAALAVSILAGRRTSSQSAFTPSTSLPAGRHDDIPSPASLEPMAELAARLPVEDATAFSKRCFANARKSDSPSASDPCIAFDTAFTYWQQGVGGAYLAEPYFQPQAEAARTENALEHLNSDAAMVRAASIRASTFEALLKVVESHPDQAQANIDDIRQIGEEDASANDNFGVSQTDTSAP